MSNMSEEEKGVFSTHIILTSLALILTFSLLSLFVMFVANKAAIDSYDRNKIMALRLIEDTTDWRYSIKDSTTSNLSDEKVETIEFSTSDGQSIIIKSNVSVGIWDMNGSLQILGVKKMPENLLRSNANWTYIIGENDLLIKENGSFKGDFVDLLAIKELIIKDKLNG